MLLRISMKPFGVGGISLLKQPGHFLRTSSAVVNRNTFVTAANGSGGVKSAGAGSKSDPHALHNEHPKLSRVSHPLGNESFTKISPDANEIYSKDELNSIGKSHYEPKKFYDKTALFAVRVMRTGFDVVTRYRGPGGQMTKRDWLNRCLFLETIAGVPGMVAGMARHMKSLRTMQRDNGWIHTLLDEAENERMHLLIFMQLKGPGLFFRLAVMVAQGIFFNMFFLSYLLSSKTCHRFVGYLEEEAVYTYTALLKDIDDGHLKDWNTELAPPIAKAYYKLPDNATVRQVIECIRADEASHRDVNHTFAGLDPDVDKNPYIFGDGKGPKK